MVDSHVGNAKQPIHSSISNPEQESVHSRQSLYDDSAIGCPYIASSKTPDANPLSTDSCPHYLASSQRPTRDNIASGSTRNFSLPSPSHIGGDYSQASEFPLADVSHDKNPPFYEYDEQALYKNLKERVAYLTRFVDFTSDDADALNELSPVVIPLIPVLVDNVYHHLFRFDVTKKAFMPRKDGSEGRMLTDLHHLTLDASQIQVRKKTFSMYMRKLVNSDYDDFATWQYFDNVGLMHTGQPGLKHRKLMGKEPLHVDLMHLSLTLAWTIDVLTPIILKCEDWSLDHRIFILRALQKAIWIQNDLFTRHYVVRSTEVRHDKDGSSLHTRSSGTGEDMYYGPDSSSRSGINSFDMFPYPGPGSSVANRGGEPAGRQVKPRKSFFGALGF